MPTERRAIKEYNSRRPLRSRHLLCHAPFSSINFAQNGDMTACCYNRKDVLGTYPHQSIKDAWEGKTAGELREYMRGTELSGGCESCREQIFSGNYWGSRAAYYDKYASLGNMFRMRVAPPKVFEFEISNTCNLECVMCTGFFSSAIRANREKLPKLHSPYDEHFIAQVKDYLPHLEEAKFLGGEPFMISPYYEIWDAIIAVNPRIKVHITTNGTVLNKRAKESLEKMNAGIIISVDSLNKENYEKIRVNADFDVLMENIRWFMDYRNRKGLYITFAICPMISNRKHLAEIIRFCNENDIYLHFNTVWKPEEECLRYASANNLRRLIEEISRIECPQNGPIQKINRGKIKDFIAHLNSWLQEQESSTQTITRHVQQLKSISPEKTARLPSDARVVFAAILAHYEARLQKESLYMPPEEYLGRKLESIPNSMGHERFWEALMSCILFTAEQIFPEDDAENIRLKIDRLSPFMLASGAQEANRRMLRSFDFISSLASLKDIPYEDLRDNQVQLFST